nr:MAG TPA: hypothetical protein [Caudoviricetes sp.]
MREIVDAIIKYGSTPVLIAALIFIIVWFAKCFRDISEKQQIISQKSEERTTELFKMMKEVGDNTKHTHPGPEEEENRRCNDLVMSLLNCLREESGANRVSCFIYHNGGYSVTGRSFQKMSMLYEVVDGKTVSVMNSFQNVPRTMFFTLTQKLSEQGCYDIRDIEDIKDADAITYQTFYARGAKAAYCGVIKDSRKNILGFIVVEYTADKCNDEKKTKDLIKYKVSKISAALEINPEAPLNQGGKK